MVSCQPIKRQYLSHGLKLNVVRFLKYKISHNSRRRDFLCLFTKIYLSNLATVVKKHDHLIKSGTGNGKRGTGNWERGTGNGSLGMSCQRKPPKKSKMAVQKTRKRKKNTKKGIRSCLGWNQMGTKLQIRLTFYVYVLSRWYVFSIFNLFHLQYDKVLGLSFRDTWHTHITPGLLRLL